MADPLAELAKMEMFVLYNTESFNKRDGSSDPIQRNSIIEHYNFYPGKKYELTAKVRQGIIEESRGLFETNSAEFF